MKNYITKSKFPKHEAEIWVGPWSIFFASAPQQMGLHNLHTTQYNGRYKCFSKYICLLC